MSNNVSEEIARLAQLREQGILTQEEFDAQKARLLGADSSAPAASPPVMQKKSGGKKGCLIAVAVIVVLLIIAGVVGGGEKAATTNAAPAENASTPPMAVTATELFTAYQANEASAQQLYGDRPLLVSGTVDAVDLDFSDKPVVKLKTPNQLMSAQANLTETSQAKASSLAKGQSVKLLCGGVSEVIGTPMLKDCEIQ